MKKKPSSKSHLCLKWGTLKAWDFSDNPKAQRLYKLYQEAETPATTLTLNGDNPKQQKILCQIIDTIPGKIYLDWDAIYVSKVKAKKYVMDYNKLS